MNEEMIKLDDEQFGALIQMPAIYDAGKLTVDGAKKYTAGILATLDGIDITKVDGLEMEKLMEPVRECRSFLAEARGEINEKRMPHTRKMDAIKGLFTGLEGDLKGLEELTAAKENAWEQEKLTRQRAANKLIQDQANKVEERVKLRTILITGFNNEFTRLILAEILGMNNGFNSKTAEELPAYGDALLNWTPSIDESIFSVPISLPIAIYHHPNDIAIIRQEVTNELQPSLSSQWIARIEDDKRRLIDLIPSRIAELQEAATSQEAATAMTLRQKADTEAIANQVQQQGQDMQEVARSNAQGEVMNGVAAVAAQATPVVQMASGSKVKQKYKVNSHQGMVSLIADYIKNDMQKLTMDEINTKFSFVRTACDKRLNQAQPIIIESAGLEVIDDVSTRRANTKTGS